MNDVGLYMLWILAHSALAIGVENGTVGQISSIQVMNLSTLSLTELDKFLYKAWLSTFRFLNRCGEWMTLLRDFLTELAKFLLLLSIQVMNLSTFIIVNRCGGWYYWGTFWLNWTNFFTRQDLAHSDFSIGVENEWHYWVSYKVLFFLL